MNMQTLTRDDVFKLIDNVIADLKYVYWNLGNSRRRFLTEDDYKCYIYARLYEKLYPNMNDPFIECNVALHSEIAFGLNGSLNYKPDLSLFFRDFFAPHPNLRKFQWSCPKEGVVAFIEIKFIRNKDSNVFTLIEKDVKKLRKLLGLEIPEFVPCAKGYLLCFAFNDDHRQDIQELLNKNPGVEVHFFAGCTGEDLTLIEDWIELDTGDDFESDTDADNQEA